MRPTASSCKVGRRFQNFVVRTRKANQHTSRRVKYWAKLPTSKPKPKKVSKASKPTRKNAKRKLRGGKGDDAELVEVLRNVVRGGQSIAKVARCDEATTNAINKIHMLFDFLDIPEDANTIAQMLVSAYNKQVVNPKPRPYLNALAIVRANILKASSATKRDKRLLVDCNLLPELNTQINYAPSDQVYTVVQAEFPFYITSIFANKQLVPRDARFDDESMKQTKRLLVE